MIIPCTTFGSLEEYLSFGDAAKPQKPLKCPRCGRRGTFQWHGSYWRKALEGQREAEIKIWRCRCQLCRLVVSLLYTFLLPYRRFTVRTVAAGVEGYICEPGTYRLWAYEIFCLPPERDGDHAVNADMSVTPHYSQVYRWVKGMATHGEWLLHQVQKELMLLGRIVANSMECPNASRALTVEKRNALNSLCTVLGFGRSIVPNLEEVARGLHAYFLSSAETQFLFLIGTAQRKWFPQSLQRVIF